MNIIDIGIAKNNTKKSLLGQGSIQGQPGKNGKDGISPTVTTTPITGGHKVTITDATGAHSFDIMDGHDCNNNLTSRSLWVVNMQNNDPPINGQTNIASLDEFIGHKPDKIHDGEIGLILSNGKLYWVEFNITNTTNYSVEMTFTRDAVLVNGANDNTNTSIHYVTENSYRNPFILNENELGIYIFDDYTIYIQAINEDVNKGHEIQTCNGVLIVTSHVEENSEEGTILGYYMTSNILPEFIVYKPKSTLGKIGTRSFSISPNRSPLMISGSSVEYDTPILRRPKSDTDADYYEYTKEEEGSDKYLATIGWVKKYGSAGSNNDFATYVTGNSEDNPFTLYGKKPGIYIFDKYELWLCARENENADYPIRTADGCLIITNELTDDTQAEDILAFFKDLQFTPSILKYYSNGRVDNGHFVTDTPLLMPLMYEPGPFFDFQRIECNNILFKGNVGRDYGDIDEKDSNFTTVEWIKNMLQFNADGELVVTINGVSKTFVPKA